MRELVAILRGIRPDEAVSISQALIDAGICCIEVPLNSPDPFNSIEKIANKVGGDALVGAGTVLREEDISRLHDAGGRLAVSPDCNPDVIRAARAHDMVTVPGVLTPTECFTALRSGASKLKIFPSFVLGCNGLKAIMAVLPPQTDVLAVGGVDEKNFESWVAAGATGFGIGSALYQPGDSPQVVGERARSLVTAFDDVLPTGS